MKKIIVVLLILLIMSLVGCASKETDSTNNKSVSPKGENEVKIKEIAPDEVLNMYYEALENPESENVAEETREKIKQLLQRSKETLGEDGPPNELLPEVRLNVIDNDLLWTKIEVLEFANESYKTGRSLILKAIYDQKHEEWILDDLEIIKASDKPFLLTWEEVEKFASLKGLEVLKSNEQQDPQFFQFSVINDNQMYVKGSILQIDRENGLISYVKVPEENESDEQTPNTDFSSNEDSVSSSTGKTNYSNLIDYEGDWQDPNGIYYLSFNNISGNSADISFDICSNKCAQIKSVGPVTLTFTNNTVSHHYEDDGWGDSGDFTLTLQPNGIIVSLNGKEIALSQ
jgi:hypothetical protein